MRNETDVKPPAKRYEKDKVKVTTYDAYAIAVEHFVCFW